MRTSRVFLAAFALYLLTIPVYFVYKSGGNTRSLVDSRQTPGVSPAVANLHFSKRGLSEKPEVGPCHPGRKRVRLLHVRAQENPALRPQILYLRHYHRG